MQTKYNWNSELVLEPFNAPSRGEQIHGSQARSARTGGLAGTGRCHATVYGQERYAVGEYRLECAASLESKKRTRPI